MGLSNSKGDICDARNVVSGCKDVMRNNKNPIKNSSKIISFCKELRDYLDFEFGIEDIEFLEYEFNHGDILKRGKSHDVSLIGDLKENRRNGVEFNRSETYNIGKNLRNEYKGNSSDNYLKIRNFLNSNVLIRIPVEDKHFRRRLVSKRLIDRDDLIDTTMRYICGADKNVTLPLFPSSLYTSNITSNPWYTLTGILEQGYTFEIPEGIDVIPLMGYTFSIDGSDIRKSPSLHNLSFLECLRLFLREKRIVEFSIIKPQIWFKPIDKKDAIVEYNFSKNQGRGISDSELQEQERYYSQSIIYCTILSGNVNIVENKDNVEIWWNFGTNTDVSSYNTVHLPLLASLDVGVSKIENWLLNETIKYPKSWTPFIVPRKIISSSTPISVHETENLLIDALIFWRCQYFIKSLNIYNACLMNITNNKFNQDELLNQINKTDISQNYTNSILTRLINEDHITNYIICFSELFNQFESWKVTHRITSDYCMEMMSLICLNCLIASEYLLDAIKNIEVSESKIQLIVDQDSYLGDEDSTEELIKMKFVSFLCKILLLKGISLKNLLKYQTREFLVRHLKSKIQNSLVNEKINKRDALPRILEIFESNEVLVKSAQAFVTNLNLLKNLKFKYNEYPVINEIIMSSILFFAETDRNITFAKLIGEKLINVNPLKNLQNDYSSWENVFDIKAFFKIDDFKTTIKCLNLKRDEVNTLFDHNDQKLIQSNLLLMNRRLERVFESIQIGIHVVRIKLNTNFINFLLPRAVDEVKEELYYLRKGAYPNDLNYREDNQMFSSCCQSKEMDSISFIHDLNIKKLTFENLNNHSNENIPENENNSPRSNTKPMSISSILFSVAKSLISRNKGPDINGIQCCNTTKTDFRNLLDLADANSGNYEPPIWSISDKTMSTEGPSFIMSQKKQGLEELILDWIKLRCWNFTDSDLRWIDGCRYIGAGEYEASLMQLSPNMTIENVAKRILDEVDHSEVRRSLKSIIFEETSPLILVRNHIIPFGELLLPSPNITHLIGAIKSCKYR